MRSISRLIATLAALLTSSLAQVSLVTVTSTTEILASATSSSLDSDATACASSPKICPACDGDTINDASGATYAVHCDSIISSSNQYAVSSGNATQNARQCLEACDEYDGCLGAYFLAGGECALATGSINDIIDQPGYEAFVAVGVGPAVILSSNSSVSSTSTLSLRATSGTSASYSIGTAITRCPLNDIICPACNDDQIVDAQGKAYTVHCDYQLFADDNDGIGHQTTPQGCLAACDNTTWCKGTTFTAGTCELANGSDVFPQQMPGYTAFLPVASTTRAPHTSPSRYPGSFPIPTNSSPTSVSATANPAPSCDPDIARCPACDGRRIVDWFNTTYTISCSEEPVCQGVVNKANHTLQWECLEYCDADPVCFAAMWSGGQCNLCQDSLEGTIFDAIMPWPADYVVFYPDAVSTNASMTTISSHQSTSHTTSTRRTRRTSPTTLWTETLSTPVPASMADILCPAADSSLFIDPTDRRHYHIQCDTGFGAQESSIMSASGFAACASLCTGDCDGLLFGQSTSCALFTSISILSSASGWTAGIWIPHPTSASHSPTTSVEPSLSILSRQGQTFITAPAPSSTAAVSITTTISKLGDGTASPDVTRAPSTTSAPMFIPPLTNGSVSYARPGDETRLAGQ